MTDDQVIALLLAARLFAEQVARDWTGAHRRFAAALADIRTMRPLGMGEHVDPVTPRLEQARELLHALHAFSITMLQGRPDRAMVDLGGALEHIEALRYPSMAAVD